MRSTFALISIVSLVVSLGSLLGLATGCKSTDETAPTNKAPTAVPSDRGTEPAADDVGAMAAAYDKLAASFYAAYMHNHPGAASSLGYHEYDGKLGDISAKAIADELGAYKRALVEFKNFDGKIPNQYELQIFLAHIRDRIFDLEVLRSPFRNPMGYPWALDLTRYISRDYAPIAERAAAIISTCKQAPAYFAVAQKNLEEKLPRTMVETALLQAKGTISFVKDDVPQAMAALDAKALAELVKGLGGCIEAMTGYREFLEARKKTATDDFAIGGEAFRRMLADSEGLEIDLAQLKKIGQADLDRNLAALKAAAKVVTPRGKVADALAVVAKKRPAVDKVLKVANAQLSETKRFLVENKIVSIPSEDIAEVAPTPAFMRWNFAFLSSPGPFETKSLPSFYYITPPDPSWPKKVQREYIATEADLLFVSVHEVWPGHFLHHLHAKRSESVVAKSFCTYSMSEGWAHYTEEMMWEAGLGGGDEKIHIGQLQNALLRNVRFLSAIGLHTEGMSVAESKQMFLEKGLQDEGNAAQQANRGTFDPGYLNYTLGKLMIRKLHADFKKKLGGAYTIAKFHDEFLSYQCAPVPVIRKLMLGKDAGPAL